MALAASGTVTAELALAHTPMVVGYKVGGLTFFLSKFLMTVTHITLINILLGREAVPEFLQARATPDNLALALGTMSRSESLNSVRRHFLSLCPPTRLALAVSAAGKLRASPVPCVFFFACHAL